MDSEPRGVMVRAFRYFSLSLYRHVPISDIRLKQNLLRIIGGGVERNITNAGRSVRILSHYCEEAVALIKYVCLGGIRHNNPPSCAGGKHTSIGELANVPAIDAALERSCRLFVLIYDANDLHARNPGVDVFQ